MVIQEELSNRLKDVCPCVCEIMKPDGSDLAGSQQFKTRRVYMCECVCEATMSQTSSGELHSSERKPVHAAQASRASANACFY